MKEIFSYEYMIFKRPMSIKEFKIGETGNGAFKTELPGKCTFPAVR